MGYFTSHGSNVYMASLDATKAFDRVRHIKLFEKLLEVGLPGDIVKVIFDWYSKTFATVKWNHHYSSFMQVRSGIRQGGILSALLFNICVNSIILSLRSADLGCHISGVFLDCICYADDILPISASIIKLQKMIDICHSQDGTVRHQI